jgi:hypothetical protein
MLDATVRLFFSKDQNENKYHEAVTMFGPRIDSAIEFVFDTCTLGTFSGIVGERAEQVGRIQERREENRGNRI